MNEPLDCTLSPPPPCLPLPSSLPGVNVYLVEVCLEYLHQPSSLKEEGIFRVPGDASIIRSLHSDFLGRRATKEFLRYETPGLQASVAVCPVPS